MEATLELRAEQQTTLNAEQLMEQIQEQVQRITAAQKKAAGHEGEVVAAMIQIGKHLIDLKAQAKRTWAKKLKELDYAPRVASRYKKIAEAWGEDFGLIESDFRA